MKKSWFVVAAAIPLVAVGSIAVWQLSGNDRRVGALGPLEEPIAVSWRGTWSADSKYEAGQMVSHDGMVYLAETQTGGVSPDPKECETECPWAPLGGAGSAGPQGPPGPKGDPGAKGDPGPAGGVSDWEIVQHDFTLPASAELDRSAVCPTGKKVLGGGFGGYNFSAKQSRPWKQSVHSDEIAGWTVKFVNDTAAPTLAVVYAVCAD